MKKLAIIGASYLQEPLIEKAKSLAIETHVFAWACGDVGEIKADYFYPISIIEKDLILEKCKEIGIDGICSIASDLATITVNYVANKMGLVGNSNECVNLSTNKHKMREAFAQNGDPSPKSYQVSGLEDLAEKKLVFPIIVKPTDRSGSRGITKLDSIEGLKEAIVYAKDQGFEKKVLVEEFVKGKEYSVECISWKGKHFLLAITEKFTTGSPSFIETGHIEPANILEETKCDVKNIVFHALDSLKIENGASHSELKIDNKGRISIIEIGARMGGDCIGSHLVEISTGIDFLKAVIDIALGNKPDLKPKYETNCAGIRYIFSNEDIKVLQELKAKHPEYLLEEIVATNVSGIVSDSSSRFGMFIIKAKNQEDVRMYMPEQQEE